MENEEELKKDRKKSLYRIRKTIGIFGLLLPWLLLGVHREMLSSMSHYYYTSSSIFFIGVLFAFGLLLISYRGYPKEENSDEKHSDDKITTIAGICIFITVLVPTKSDGAMGHIFFTEYPYLFGHASNKLLSTLHLVSAGLFITLLGVMSFHKFTLSKSMTESRKKFFRVCGWIIWGCVAMLIILFVADEFVMEGTLNSFFPGYTFWLETAAVETFAITWLVKGKAIGK